MCKTILGGIKCQLHQQRAQTVEPLLRISASAAPEATNGLSTLAQGRINATPSPTRFVSITRHAESGSRVRALSPGQFYAKKINKILNTFYESNRSRMQEIAEQLFYASPEEAKEILKDLVREVSPSSVEECKDGFSFLVATKVAHLKDIR